MSDELKPCEDCKSNDLEVSWIETGFNKWWHVLCQECSNERNAATKAEAIAAWNTRHTPKGNPDE